MVAYNPNNDGTPIKLQSPPAQNSQNGKSCSIAGSAFTLWKYGDIYHTHHDAYNITEILEANNKYSNNIDI